MANKPSGNSGFSEDNGDGSSATASGTELLESCHVLEHGYSDRAQPSEGDDTSNNTIPSGSESSSASVATGRIDRIQQYFEEEGYRVKIHGGNHFISSDQRLCVEMQNGTVFHIELSNYNDYGCDVDIRMLKLNPGEIPRTDIIYRYEDVGGWRLDPHEQNFAIHNSAYEQGKFVFYSSDPGKMKDENRKNQENLRSVFEVTFTPEAYSLYFKMRNDDNEGVTNVRFPKRPDGNLRDALKRLEEKKTTEEKKKIKEKYKLEKNKMMQEKKSLETKYNTKKREIMHEKMRVEGKEMMEEAMKMEKEKWINEEKRMEEEYKMVLNEWKTKMGRIEKEFQVQEKERIEEIEKYFAESCFFDGQTIFRDKLISAIINNQSKTNPLLRLKEKERISVQLGGGERKEVDINPLNFDVKEVTEKMSDLFGEGDYELKVEGEVITADNWVKCLKGEAVKVSKIEKETVVPATEHRGYRGIGLTRGLNFGSQGGFRGFSGLGYRGNFDEDDDEILSLSVRGGGSTGRNDTMSNPSLPAGIGVVRYEGQPVQTFQTVRSDNNAPFVTSPDDKVVMTINLVSLS